MDELGKKSGILIRSKKKIVLADTNECTFCVIGD